MAARSIPVLIVGAGPTGLNLAYLLAQFGIHHRIIDMKVEPIHTSNALAVQTRTIEMWDSMGLIDDVLALGKKLYGLSFYSKKRKIATISFKKANLDTPYPFILGLSQADTEHMLSTHLIKLGGKVERGIALVDFEQHPQFISAKLKHQNGDEEVISCDWMVAADGAHSVVRKKLALDFKGAAIHEDFIMMDAKISLPLDPNYGHGFLSPRGPLVFLEMRDFTRIICVVTGDTGIKDYKNPTVSDFEYAIQTRSTLSYQIKDIHWISHFTVSHRLTEHYRIGRVLLAGDSAHIHSPIGGQGMNMGMQDSYNLAWKLASVVKGYGGAVLLDTYTVERRPVAKSVLFFTTIMTHVMTAHNRLLILLRNFIFYVMFKFHWVQKKLLTRLAELNITYQKNLSILNNGQRALDAILHDKQKNCVPLRHLLRGFKHKVLLFTGKNYTAKQAQDILHLIGWMNTEMHGILDPIVISTSEQYFENTLFYIDESFNAHQRYKLLNGGMCVIRPDQHIAYLNSTINQAILLTLVDRLRE